MTLHRTVAHGLLAVLLACALVLAGPARPASAGVMQWATQIPPSLQGATIEAKAGATALGGGTGAYAGWLSKPSLATSLKWGAAGAAVGLAGWAGYEVIDDGIIFEQSQLPASECFNMDEGFYPAGWAYQAMRSVCYEVLGIDGDNRWHTKVTVAVDPDLAAAEGFTGVSLSNLRGWRHQDDTIRACFHNTGTHTKAYVAGQSSVHLEVVDCFGGLDPTHLHYDNSIQQPGPWPNEIRADYSDQSFSGQRFKLQTLAPSPFPTRPAQAEGIGPLPKPVTGVVNESGGAAERVTRGTYRCVEYGTGGVLEPLVADSEPWTPQEGGGTIPTPEIECPSGYAFDGLTLEAVETGGDLEPIPLADWTAPVTELEATYPLCMPGTNGGPCALELHRVTTGGATEVCDVGTCAGWWYDPNRESKFQCHWGPYVMSAVADCVSLQKSYNTGTALEITPSTNLQTGEAIQTDQPSPTESGCGISWANPFTGMARAVGCALEWAFVPSQVSMTKLTGLGDTLGDKSPFYEVGEAAGVVGQLNGDLPVGCLVISVPVMAETYTVMDSCAPDAVSAWLQGNRSIITAFMWLFVLVPWVLWFGKRITPLQSANG